MESTYGDRLHDKSGDVETQLCQVISDTIGRGGNVVIPTFAIERAQELMYYIGRLVYAQNAFPRIPIFLDSPMAVDVTEIFRQHRNYLDDETRKVDFVEGAATPLLRPANGAEPSSNRRRSTICESPASSCRQRACVLRAESSITCDTTSAAPKARSCSSAFRPTVRWDARFWKAIKRCGFTASCDACKAKVAHINGLSGHADQAGLLDWLSHLQTPPRHVFLAHGEEAASECLAGLITQRWGWPVSIPDYESVVELG